jgi:hypothetical protein
MDMEKFWAETDADLKRQGLARTRENYIRELYEQPPEGWDEDCEAQLPPDLRLPSDPD